MQVKGLWDFVNESKEVSGNSQVDRVLSLFRESTLSISVELLIVAGDELTGYERVSGRVPAVGVSGSMFSRQRSALLPAIKTQVSHHTVAS